MRPECRCVVVAGLVALATAPGAAAADSVILKEGKKPYRGTVIRDDAREVVLRVEGTSTFARERVREVVYDDGRPVEYSLGREAASEGRHADAARLFAAALEAPHHELLEQYILLHLARAEERTGRVEEARAALRRLAEKGGRTRFLFEAMDGLSRLGAEVPAAAPDSGLTETQRLLLRAAIQARRGRHDSALGLFGRAGRRAASGTFLARRAELGAAGCLVKLGRGAEAAMRLRRFLIVCDDEFRAEAYVLLGDALAADADGPDDWREAAYAYLRVAVHYPGDPATEVPAFAGAARCFGRVPGGGAARAKRLEEHLAKRYPSAAGEGG